MNYKIRFFKDKKDYIHIKKNTNIINITGISGSGKTTLAKKIQQENKANIVNLDAFFGFCKKSEIESEISEKISEKYKELKQKDSVNMLYKEIVKYIEQKNEKYIIEGTQIYNFIEYKNLEGSLIIKRTSIYNCCKRILKRDVFRKTTETRKKRSFNQIVKNRLKKIEKIFKIIIVNKRKINVYIKTSMKKEKNIFLMISKLADGGAERAINNIATKLSEKYNVYLVIFNEKRKEYIPTVPVIHIKELHYFGINTIKGILKLRRLKKEYNITHSISFLPKPNLYNVLSKYREKTIISIRNTMSLANTKMENTIHRFITSKLADLIVPVSKIVEYDQRTRFNIKTNKMKVIYNFCDIDKINEQAQESIDKDILDIFKDSKVVINVGKLYKQKGQIHLIRAFSEVVKEIPNAKLIILGKGKEEIELELKEAIKNLKLENNVYLLGFDNNPYKYMKRADIFILSSLFEGMPNVVLEAMACGLPIISTDCKSGPREILAPETNINEFTNEIEYAKYGILIPICKEEDKYKKELSKEEKDMKNSIIELIRNQDLNNKYRELSSKRIMDFDKDKIIEQWHKIIEN